MANLHLYVDGIQLVCYSSSITVIQVKQLLISLSEQDPQPIYSQIVSQIKRQIRDGDLLPGDELPSVRELSESLGINLHTVHHAYRILKEQGIVYLRLGQRAKVARLPVASVEREQVNRILAPRLNELIVEAYYLGLSREEFLELVQRLLLNEENEGDTK